jgi:hypothetical protein
VVDVPNDLGNALLTRGLAEPPTMKGEAKAAAVTGVKSDEDEESPVDSLTVPEAAARIATMRSKDKLQHIIDNDKRTGAVEAAKKRLAEL